MDFFGRLGANPHPHCLCGKGMQRRMAGKDAISCHRFGGTDYWYWANIGHLVYGMTEARLLQLTGNHSDNPTMDLPCREVFARGQKAIEVIGPVAEVEAEIAALHRDFWKK